MKKLITAIVCLASLSSFAQNAASYSLTTPRGWSAERSSLASRISPNGVEDLRLAPGWNDSKSNAYWTYASLWTLDGDQKTDEKTMEKNLAFYLTDMLNKSMKKGKTSTVKTSSVKAWVTELNNEKGDFQTYFGAIAIPNAKGQMPTSLHCLIHVRKYPGQNKTLIFYEFSPNPLNDTSWASLDQLWSEFDNSPSQKHNSN